MTVKNNSLLILFFIKKSLDKLNFETYSFIKIKTTSKLKVNSKNTYFFVSIVKKKNKHHIHT